MSHFRGSLLLALVACLAARGALAGTISISISPGTIYQPQDGRLVADVQVANSGDEAAHNVSALLRFGDKEVRGQPTATLPPGGSMKSDLALDVGQLGTGHYPFQVAVDYADSNQYPFQALHVGLLTVGSPTPAKIAVRDLKADPFASRGTLRLVVKNLSSAKRETTVRIAAPDGIEVTEPAHTVALEPWAESPVAVPLVNRSALAGSRLPVFAMVEYEDEGVHHAVVGQGMVGILASQSFYQENQTALVTVAVVLVVGWLGFVLWWVLSRSRRAESRA